VTRVLGEGEFPVVLGGDCSILLGTMLALRRRGRYGLLYIDGDADFYQPEVNPLRGAASASDLAFATGYGPDVVTDIESRRPLVRADDVVVVACRDADDRERRGCQPLPAGMQVIRSGRAAGLQVAIYNPDIDADGSNGRGLAATVREALAASADASGRGQSAPDCLRGHTRGHTAGVHGRSRQKSQGAKE
jgi:arginase family enzyme